jgi:hypothetical protein
MRRDEATPAELKRLRELCGGDRFLHRPQIKRQRMGDRERLPWMTNVGTVSEFLRQRFPRAYEDCTHPPGESCVCCQQRYTAMFWSFVVRECYWGRETAASAAATWCEEYQGNISPDLRRGFVDAAYVRRAIQQMKFATEGLRMDGRVRGGKRGRPRKLNVRLEPLVVGSPSPRTAKVPGTGWVPHSAQSQTTQAVWN